MLKSHEEECEKVANELILLTALVVKVRQGSEEAARELYNRLGHRPYDGAVIYIPVDSIIANVLDKESD